MKEGVENPSKLEDYEGYIPDLLANISGIINKKFTIRKVADGKYGAKSSDGTWNGMIRELMDDVSDMTLANIVSSRSTFFHNKTKLDAFASIKFNCSSAKQFINASFESIFTNTTD